MIPKNKKGLFFDACHDFIDRNQESTSIFVPIFDQGPILEIPQRFEQLFQRKSIEKVIKLRDFFKSVSALIEDKDVMV